MNICIYGKPFTLEPWQVNRIYREQSRILLEEKAQAILDAYLRDLTRPGEINPSLTNIYNPRHIDYLADQIAERFLQNRKDTITEASAWKRSIRQVLNTRQKSFAALPAYSEHGPWSLRPFDSLLRLMWRSKYNMESLDFCTDESIAAIPEMPYRVFFSCTDTLLYVHVEGTHSRLLHLLDDGTERVYTYEDFADAVKDFLMDDMKCSGRKFPKYIWVYDQKDIHP